MVVVKGWSVVSKIMENKWLIKTVEYSHKILVRFPTSGLMSLGCIQNTRTLVVADTFRAHLYPLGIQHSCARQSEGLQLITPAALCLWAREPESPWFTCQADCQCQEVNNGNWLIPQLIPTLGGIFLRCDPWFFTKMTPTFYTEMDFNPHEILTRILITKQLRWTTHGWQEMD